MPPPHPCFLGKMVLFRNFEVFIWPTKNKEMKEEKRGKEIKRANTYFQG